MKEFFKHAQSYVFRGLLAFIPILLCWWAIKILYVLIDQKVINFLSLFWEVRKIPGLGILILLVFLYFVGMMVSNIIGRQFMKGIDDLSQRIPFIKQIYSVGKQLSQSLSLTEGEKQAFKKGVLVKVSESGPLLPAFVMNTIKNPQTSEEIVFVLIPTAPNPASGFVAGVKPSQIIDPGWTVEECLKAVVSIGIVLPKDKDAGLWGGK